jgi:integrase
MKLTQFKRGESEKLFNKLNSEEQKDINNFVKYVSITSKSDKRLENNKRSLLTFRKATAKPLSKTTLKDLRDFLALLNNSDRTQASRNELKHTLKRFLKWKFKDWSERFDNLQDIKLIIRINEEKINADTLLKKEDIEAIMKAEPKLFWKAFFISLYESGLRPIELRTLLWKNIKFDIDKDDLSEINIYATKTNKARSVYVKEATFYLKKLKEQSKSEYVFPSIKDSMKPMGKELPAVWLKRISKKVLNREVYPYILRHSRATELYTNIGIPDKTAQKFLGHSKSMSDIYTHLSNKDIKDAVSKTIYQTQDIPPEKKTALEQEVEQLKTQLTEIKKNLSDVLEMGDMIKALNSLKNGLTDEKIKEINKNNKRYLLTASRN